MHTSVNFPASHHPKLDREPHSDGNKCGKMLLDGLQFAPHSHVVKGAIPQLCIAERNRPMPVPKRLSLTKASLGKCILDGREPTSAM